MKFNNKNYILLLAIFIGIIPVLVYKACSIAPAITPNLITNNAIMPKGINDCYTSITPNEVDTSKEIYTQWLETQELAIWKDVKKLTGISSDECKKLITEFQKAHNEETATLRTQLKLSKEISPQIKKIIDGVVKDLGCQPLEIINCEYPVAAATHGPIVFVNEEIFSTMSLSAQKFVVAHEIIHILLKDDEMRFVLKNKNFFTNDESLDYAINKLYRFQELRADMLAALTSANYAQGYNEYVHNALSRREGQEITEPFYPTYALRKDTSEKIQQVFVA